MLLLSILLSIIVGALVFWALTELLVKPIERLSANMVGFAEWPEDRSRIISPRPDGDEIAAAERALAAMQNELSGMLAQKNHLAALGLAVSKVSHDLRNMLTSAQLLSDRLGHVNDPTVQKVAPKLISSLDRAIGFLTQILQFGRAQEPPPVKERIVLKPLVKEVFAVTALSSGGRVKLINAVDDKAVVEADREQLTRILGNLIRNAVQALDQDDRSAKPQAAVTIATRRERHTLHISVADNGPGIPEAVRGKLFQAFHASATPGGTGLGLAIAAELAEAHGGGLALVKSDETGTVLELTLPAPESQARAGARTQGLPSPGQRIMNRPLKRR
jgi:signal transduction histidine kinase